GGGRREGSADQGQGTVSPKRMKSKSARWPFGPRSRQESPTPGAKTEVRLGEPYRADTQHPTRGNVVVVITRCNQNLTPMLRSPGQFMKRKGRGGDGGCRARPPPP